MFGFRRRMVIEAGTPPPSSRSTYMVRPSRETTGVDTANVRPPGRQGWSAPHAPPPVSGRSAPFCPRRANAAIPPGPAT